MMRYRVEASDVYLHLIAHDTISMPEGHFEPRLVVPPPSHGVPRLHRSSHLLVVCITQDWRFAQQLDEIVRALVATEPRPLRTVRTNRPQRLHNITAQQGSGPMPQRIQR